MPVFRDVRYRGECGDKTALSRPPAAGNGGDHTARRRHSSRSDMRVTGCAPPASRQPLGDYAGKLTVECSSDLLVRLCAILHFELKGVDVGIPRIPGQRLLGGCWGFRQVRETVVLKTWWFFFAFLGSHPAGAVAACSDCPDGRGRIAK